jgi:hypothetical protein
MYFSDSDFGEKRIFFTLQKRRFSAKLIDLRYFSFRNKKKGHQLKNITLLHSVGVVPLGNISFLLGFSRGFALKNITSDFEKYPLSPSLGVTVELSEEN